MCVCVCVCVCACVCVCVCVHVFVHVYVHLIPFIIPQPIVTDSAPFDQKAFMEKYQKRFMECVPAEIVASDWELDKIIHVNTRAEIKRALPSEQCGILFKYIRTHGSLATIRKMCDLMIKTGEEMKKDLKQYR